MYYWQFSKKISLPKNGGHFEFLPKMEKHKFPSISLIVRDRAISSKFSSRRVFQQSTLANFVQVSEQNSYFPLGGHYACQCVLFLVEKLVKLKISLWSGEISGCPVVEMLYQCIYNSRLVFIPLEYF